MLIKLCSVRYYVHKTMVNILMCVFFLMVSLIPFEGGEISEIKFFVILWTRVTTCGLTIRYKVNPLFITRGCILQAILRIIEELVG